jgi:hypothetical protein
MPKNTYTQKDFEKDLSELEKLIEENNKYSNNQRGGRNNRNNNNNNDNYYDDDEDDNESYYGGANSEEGKRHFKIVELKGKAVDFARITISDKATPLNAAKKALLSIAEKEELEGNDKVKLNVTFSIQETTQGSKKKIYGPYSGKFHKYTKEEAEKASYKIKLGPNKGKVITPKMKPMVKLHKGNMHKGGAQRS